MILKTWRAHRKSMYTSIKNSWARKFVRGHKRWLLCEEHPQLNFALQHADAPKLSKIIHAFGYNNSRVGFWFRVECIVFGYNNSRVGFWFRVERYPNTMHSTLNQNSSVAISQSVQRWFWKHDGPIEKACIQALKTHGSATQPDATYNVPRPL